METSEIALIVITWIVTFTIVGGPETHREDCYAILPILWGRTSKVWPYPPIMAGNQGIQDAGHVILQGIVIDDIPKRRIKLIQ
jgi:hypothetical protein